jgi:hypothetical protein
MKSMCFPQENFRFFAIFLNTIAESDFKGQPVFMFLLSLMVLISFFLMQNFSPFWPNFFSKICRQPVLGRGNSAAVPVQHWNF